MCVLDSGAYDARLTLVIKNAFKILAFAYAIHM